MKTTLWKAARVKLLAFGLFAAFAVPFTLNPLNVPNDIALPSDVMEDRPIAEGSPDALLAEHDCWTGAAPADMQGQIPGHVVATKPGAIAPTYGGERMVGKALGQVFDGEDHGLTIYGFCR